MNDPENLSDKIDLSQIPSFPYLAAFERAAMLGSFAKAAHDLGRTPSAISRAISELEEKFGCVLFERIGRTVKLTKAGENYLKGIREALRILDLSGKNVAGKNESYVINLHTQPLIASELIIPLLPDFKKRYPELELNVEVSRRRVDWSKQNPDVELRFGEVEDEKLQTYDIGKIGIVPACSPSLMQGNQGLKEITDLERFTILLDVLRPDSWDNWLRAVGYSHLELRHQMRFEDFLAILGAMMNGVGVSLVPYPFVMKYPCYGKGVVVPFAEAQMDFLHYKLICRKDRRTERKIASFSEWLHEKFGELNFEPA